MLIYSYVHATKVPYQLIHKTRYREYIVAIALHADRGNLCSGVTSYGQQAQWCQPYSQLGMQCSKVFSIQNGWTWTLIILHITIPFLETNPFQTHLIFFIKNPEKKQEMPIFYCDLYFRIIFSQMSYFFSTLIFYFFSAFWGF